MKNVIFACVCAMVCVSARGALKHVPASFSEMGNVRLIKTAAGQKSHVQIVNVNGAIPEPDFALAAHFAASRLQVNIWTNSLKSVDFAGLEDADGTIASICGSKAAIAVFMVNDAKGPAFLNAPGKWSRVNVRSLAKGGPDAQTLRDRYAKMMLKGLAYAAGAGVSIERNCVLYYESFSLKGMDATDITISPMSYFPMIEVLQGVGGPDILMPDEEPNAK